MPRRAGGQRSDKKSGQERLLRAAEELIRSQGPKDLSVREISAAAGMNNAAVNYHFGSKEDLLCELFRLHTAEYTAKNLALLNGIINKDFDMTLEEFVAAWYGRDADNEFFVLIHALFADNYPDLLTKIMSDSHDRYKTLQVKVLKQYLPHLDEKTISWRIFMIAGAQLLIYSRVDAPVLVNMSEGQSNPNDHAEMMQQLIALVVGALRAPLP